MKIAQILAVGVAAAAIAAFVEDSKWYTEAVDKATAEATAAAVKANEKAPTGKVVPLTQMAVKYGAAGAVVYGAHAFGLLK